MTAVAEAAVESNARAVQDAWVTLPFDSLGEFLAMGGYGFYVWWAYLLAGLVIAFAVLWPLWQRRRFMREQRQRLRRAAAANRGRRPAQVE